jgi:hypothetical protein
MVRSGSSSTAWGKKDTTEEHMCQKRLGEDMMLPSAAASVLLHERVCCGTVKISTLC